MSALTCHHITKTFGATTAVSDLSFSLEYGSFFALLGPSGCGKTTSLRLIAGLERPTSGSIQIGGQVVADSTHWLPPHQRQVGLVFQDYALFPHMNVARNVAYGVRGSHAKRRVAEVLELVGLTGMEQRMPYELSGGQQQRVALARALAPAPQILLLDEPFSSLDASLRQQVRVEMRRILKATDITTILVTHDQEEAFSLADEVGVMLNGTLQQVATPRTLYEQPANAAIAAFVGETNFLEGVADGSTVQCALGQLPLPTPQIGRVHVMLRPEHLSLSPDATGQGEIELMTYFGHDQLLRVRLDDGTALQVRLGPSADYQRQQRVRVTVNAPITVFRL